MTEAKRSMRSKAQIRRLKAYGSAFGAFVVAGVIGIGMGSVSSGSAVANEPTGDEQTTEQVESRTPSALRATTGAQDSARYRAYEKEYDGVTFTCEAPSGANSLTSAFVVEEEALVMPMVDGTYDLSSRYGWRLDPFTYTTRMHTGDDFAAKVGTPIYSIADGVVVYAGPGAFGRSDNLVVIQHEYKGEVFTSWYVHSYLDGIYVTTGQEVEAGEVIAGVGSAGRSTGAHLHFEIHAGAFTGENPGVGQNPIAFLTDREARDVSELCN